MILASSLRCTHIILAFFEMVAMKAMKKGFAKTAMKTLAMKSAMKSESIRKKPSAATESPEPEPESQQPSSSALVPFKQKLDLDAQAKHGVKTPPCLQDFLSGKSTDWGQRQVQALRDWTKAFQKRGLPGPEDKRETLRTTEQRVELAHKLLCCKTRMECDIASIEAFTTSNREMTEGGEGLTNYQVWKLMGIPVCDETRDDREEALAELAKVKIAGRTGKKSGDFTYT